MRKVCSGKYYSAFSRYREGGGRSQLLIIRRDTKEIIKVTTIASGRVSTVAVEFIESLSRPTDWKSPHVLCLFYYIKIMRKRERFGFKLISEKLSAREIMSELKRFETYQRYLLVKLNSLSKKERLLIMTPSNKELTPTTTEEIDMLQARADLFWMFFKRNEEMTAMHAKVRAALKKVMVD